MGDFTELLGKLESLQKASDCGPDDKASSGDKPEDDAKDKKMSAKDDKKIQAAAKDGEDKSEKDEETFGKAFKVRLEDGTETEAFDGTAMLKALHAENETLRSTINEQNVDLGKAMDIVVGELKARRETEAEHATLIKALQGKLDAVSTAGVGRRTMLAIAEKLTPGTGPAAAAQAEAAKPSGNQVMMKAQFMARKGELDWGAIPRIEAFQARGQVAPADLLARYPELLTPVP